MPRSNAFGPSREPLREVRTLLLQHHHVGGPLPFLNPTKARYRYTGPWKPHEKHREGHDHKPSGQQEPDTETQIRPTADDEATAIEFQWRSRDNRKGRHRLSIGREKHKPLPAPPPPIRRIAAGLQRMCTRFPYWDISYLVAVIFTLGSALWVINAFFVFLPVVAPGVGFRGMASVGGGITAFLGATTFEVGSVLLLIEAVNTDNAACFGWALEQAWEKEVGDGGVLTRLERAPCGHHHALGRRWRARGRRTWAKDGRSKESGSSSPEAAPRAAWQWFPSLHDLRTHYLFELGFLASAAQLIGATIFWISGFTALPGVYEDLSRAAKNGVYWAPQVVGGTFFIISGALFMLETQHRWYKPALGTLGWHIGFWNLIGAIGFTLCGALGPADSNSKVEYQSLLATFWGSWAFMIASVLQWYESLDKHPVQIKKE